VLDEIPSIGPITRKKLIRYFGSGRSVLSAPVSELQRVVGPKTGAKIAHHLKALKQ
jgi:excinuclease UvrABC nuclease subunit